MRALVVAVGTRMPQWVVEAFDDYRARMPREFRMELVEVKAEKRTGALTAERAMALECQRIRAALARGCRVVALDERGRSLSSEQFAAELDRWRGDGDDVAFLIGGADGLAPELKSSAAMLLSLSRMTLPHGLARVMLAEQIYRAHTILTGHPYHRP
jgi:23S rRNA (pseudouridine1915-N3)-methyltransferase